MTTIDLNQILNQIKEEIKIAPLGNLPKGKTMDSLVGHTVISLSDITLSKDQVPALEKALTFLSYPRTPQ